MIGLDSFELMDGSVYFYRKFGLPGRHRLTERKLRYEDVRYFDYYGYLLHAGLRAVTNHPIVMDNGFVWEEDDE